MQARNVGLAAPIDISQEQRIAGVSAIADPGAREGGFPAAVVVIQIDEECSNPLAVLAELFGMAG